MTELQPNAGTHASTAPRVFVVLISWNRVDEVVRSLRSFQKLDYPNLQLVVVDNASRDATVATVREQFADVHVIANEANLGYAGGSNVGFRYAIDQGAAYVVLVNQDTEATAHLIEELVAVMESDSSIAVAGAKNLVMEAPSYTWGKYGRVNWGPTLVRTIGRLQPDVPEPMRSDVEWVIGNGCMFRSEALKRVGFFDEKFFFLNEDVDWCIRARAAGYRVVYVDAAHLLHGGSTSDDETQGRGYFLGRNAIVFARKYAKPFQWARLLLGMTVGLFVRVSWQIAYACLSAMQKQVPFVLGMLDGSRGQLNPERINVSRGPALPRSRFKDRVHEILAWFGAA